MHRIGALAVILLLAACAGNDNHIVLATVQIKVSGTDSQTVSYDAETETRLEKLNATLGQSELPSTAFVKFTTRAKGSSEMTAAAHRRYWLGRYPESGKVVVLSDDPLAGVEYKELLIAESESELRRKAADLIDSETSELLVALRKNPKMIPTADKQ